MNRLTTLGVSSLFLLLASCFALQADVIIFESARYHM